VDERQVEELLKRYRPAGPPNALRERCLPPSPATRVWPWAAAAAALLAITVGIKAAAADVIAGAGVVVTPDTSARAIADLAEVFGGDAAARRVAEQIIEQQMRRDRELVAQSTSSMGGIQ